MQRLPSKQGVARWGIQDARAGGHVGKDRLPEDGPERVGGLTSEGNGDWVEGPESLREEGEPDPRRLLAPTVSILGHAVNTFKSGVETSEDQDSSSIFRPVKLT